MGEPAGCFHGSQCSGTGPECAADATPAADPPQVVLDAIIDGLLARSPMAGSVPERAFCVFRALEAAGLRVVPATEIEQLNARVAEYMAEWLQAVDRATTAEVELERLRGVTADRYEPAPRVMVWDGFTGGPSERIAGEVLYRRVSP